MPHRPVVLVHANAPHKTGVRYSFVSSSLLEPHGIKLPQGGWVDRQDSWHTLRQIPGSKINPAELAAKVKLTLMQATK